MNFRLTPPKSQLSENDVERACLDLLRYHRYYPLRLQSGRFLHADKAVLEACRRAGVAVRWCNLGEPGIPDYVIPQFFLETKRPGGKLSAEQEAKIAALDRDWNLETAVVDDVEALAEWLGRQEKKP